MSRFSDLHSYYTSAAKLGKTIQYTIFDGGGYDGARTTGFTLGCSLTIDTNGRCHLWFGGTGLSDPSAMKTRYTYSDSPLIAGSWSSPVIFAEDVTLAKAWNVFGSTSLQLASGRILVFGSTNDADGTAPWAAYVWYTDNPSGSPPTFTGPTLITALAGTDFWAPHGRPLEISAGGDIYMPWYGQRTGDATYSAAMMKSTDHGFTWSLAGTNIGASAGDLGFGLNEPVVGYINGVTEMIVISRTTGFAYRSARTLDSGATWKTSGYIGQNTAVPNHAEPAIYACHDIPGDLLLFSSIRQTGGAPGNVDPSMRWGLICSRSKNGGRSWGDPVLLVGFTDGRLYPSPHYMGQVGGEAWVAIVYDSDFVNVDFLAFAESLIPAPIT